MLYSTEARFGGRGGRRGSRRHIGSLDAAREPVGAAGLLVAHHRTHLLAAGARALRAPAARAAHTPAPVRAAATRQTHEQALPLALRRRRGHRTVRAHLRASKCNI